MIKHRPSIRTFVLVGLLVGLLLLQIVAVSAQSTSTPVPTAVPTATNELLTLPTGVLFSATNDWIDTFAPIVAIGIGISIALAVLGYLGKMIKSAFT